MQARRNAAARRQWQGAALAVLALVAMCSAEILFLNYVASPDTVNLLTSAEGVPSVAGE
jgi:hypothetical protein